jgi:hypothetical protein
MRCIPLGCSFMTAGLAERTHRSFCGAFSSGALKQKQQLHNSSDDDATPGSQTMMHSRHILDMTAAEHRQAAMCWWCQAQLCELGVAVRHRRAHTMHSAVQAADRRCCNCPSAWQSLGRHIHTSSWLRRWCRLLVLLCLVCGTCHTTHGCPQPFDAWTARGTGRRGCSYCSSR